MLESRGLAVGDQTLALQFLARAGYYRLKAYLQPLREGAASTDEEPEEGERFRAGTTFAHAISLYQFDKTLRLLLLDAIESIEVALRVDLAHALSARDPWAHRTPEHLGDDARANLYDFRNWLRNADRQEERCQFDWVERYRAEYAHLPIWMAIEAYDLGILVTLLTLLDRGDADAIAGKYGIPDGGAFQNGCACWSRSETPAPITAACGIRSCYTGRRHF